MLHSLEETLLPVLGNTNQEQPRWRNKHLKQLLNTGGHLLTLGDPFVLPELPVHSYQQDWCIKFTNQQLKHKLSNGCISASPLMLNANDSVSSPACDRNSRTQRFHYCHRTQPITQHGHRVSLCPQSFAQIVFQTGLNSVPNEVDMQKKLRRSVHKHARS